MPIEIKPQVPSLCIRRTSFDQSSLTRASIDARLGLTADEFKVEGDLIVVGPLYGDALDRLIPMLEEADLSYFDDYFELSGNWPEWLTLFAKAQGAKTT